MATESITFRVPAKEKKEFMQRHKETGKRSKILRALLQMYLLGKIQEPTYVEK